MALALIFGGIFLVAGIVASGLSNNKHFRPMLPIGGFFAVIGLFTVSITAILAVLVSQ